MVLRSLCKASAASRLPCPMFLMTFASMIISLTWVASRFPDTGGERFHRGRAFAVAEMASVHHVSRQTQHSRRRRLQKIVIAVAAQAEANPRGARAQKRRVIPVKMLARAPT